MTDQESLPGYGEIADQIRHQALSIDPAELHGSLCGLLCGGSGREPSRWLATVLADEHMHAPEAGSPLADLYEISQSQLRSPEFGFELLLPDDDAALTLRADALLAWCRGFLGGFGLAAPSIKQLSDDAREALEDLSKIAAADLSYEDTQSDELALLEIAEFVRIAALLLHSDCVLVKRPTLN